MDTHSLSFTLAHARTRIRTRTRTHTRTHIQTESLTTPHATRHSISNFKLSVKIFPQKEIKAVVKRTYGGKVTSWDFFLIRLARNSFFISEMLTDTILFYSVIFFSLRGKLHFWRFLKKLTNCALIIMRSTLINKHKNG